MTIPGNLLSATTSTINPNASGWVAVENCVLSFVGATPSSPGWLVLTSSASGEMQAHTAALIPITPGGTYQTFADAQAYAVSERIGIQWTTSTGAVLSTTWSQTTASAAASTHRIGVAAVAPVNAACARVIVSATATATSQVNQFTNVYLGLPKRTSGNLFSFNVESCGNLNTAGWAVDANCTIAKGAPAFNWPPTTYVGGGEVIEATATAAGTMSIVTAEQPAVQPGREYVAYGYLIPPTSSSICWIELRWYNAAGTLLSTRRANLAAPGTSIYQQYVSDVAPSTAATCRLAAGITSATAGQVLGLDVVVAALASPTVPGNVLSFADTSFEASTAAWSVISGTATIARSTPWSSTGSWDHDYTLVVTATAGSTSVLASGTYPVTSHPSWRSEIYAKGESTGGGFDITTTIHAYGTGGADLGAVAQAAQLMPDNDGWWIISSDMPLPAGTLTARVELTITPQTGSTKLAIDQVGLYPALPDFEVDPDGTLARNTIILRELDPSLSMTLTRIVGGTQSLVRGPSGPLAAVPQTTTQMVIEDYEAPLGVPVSYRIDWIITSTGAFGGGATSPSVTIPAISDPSEVWIKDPLAPQRNVLVRGSVAPDWTRSIDQTVYQVRNRRNAVVLSDVRSGNTGTLQVWTLSDDERAGLDFALDTGDVLLVQFAPDLGIDDIYVSVGEVSAARVVPSQPRRLWQLPLTQVDAPIGGVGGTAGWTVRDVAVTYSSVLAVVQAYDTVLELALNQGT